MVNAPNWLPLTFRVDDGPWFCVDDVELLSYRQELDMRRGLLTRRLRFRDDRNRTTAVTQRRLVSMHNPHLVGLETTIVPENWEGTVELQAALDGRITNSGFVDAHVVEWGRLWRRCRIRVPGDSQTVVNLHVFHILQTLNEHVMDADVGVPARGLHGEAYRGHVFWDEVFVFPFLTTTFPEVARALLLYRWRRLPAARRAARASGYPGDLSVRCTQQTVRVGVNRGGPGPIMIMIMIKGKRKILRPGDHGRPPPNRHPDGAGPLTPASRTSQRGPTEGLRARELLISACRGG